MIGLCNLSLNYWLSLTSIHDVIKKKNMSWLKKIYFIEARPLWYSSHDIFFAISNILPRNNEAENIDLAISIF